MVGKAFATVSRDESASARRSLENDLAGLVDRAHDGGGREFYLLMDVLRGIPLAATLVVTGGSGTGTGRRGARDPGAVLANDPNSEPAVLEVAGENVPAVRRSEAKIMREEIPGLGPARLTFTGLDVFVPFPDRSQILLLTFRTPMEPIAASMMVLFEAVAGSLRWREA